MWTWIDNSNLINKDNATKWKVNDGATIVGNSCPVPNPAQYSYNYGFLIAGLSYLYNHVGTASSLLVAFSNKVVC